MDIKKFKDPHQIRLQGTPQYGSDYPGGLNNYKNFNFTYDFWAEPSINQGHTGTCVYHSHIGAASKLTYDNLTGFTIGNTVAYLDAWSNHHSSRFFADKLQNDKVLVPYPTCHTYTSFLNEYCYKGLERIKGKKLSRAGEDTFNVNKISLDNLDITYNTYYKADQVNIVDILKGIIDGEGVAMVSIDYPSTNQSLVSKCFGNIWFKHKIETGNYWYCNPENQTELADWFKKANDGWHSVIFFGYSIDQNGNGVFAFKNSWGSNHGENGNYYMSFDFLKTLYKNRSGGISVTKMSTKAPVDPQDAHDDYIQYMDPTGKCITVETEDNLWYYNFGNSSPVPIGTGFWSATASFGIPYYSQNYIVKEYSERYESGVKGNLINTINVTMNLNDRSFDITSDSDQVRFAARNS